MLKRKLLAMSLVFVFLASATLVAISFISAEEAVWVASWSFDEFSGSTAHDRLGRSHGTIYGAAWTTGIFGGALLFDGDDYVDVGNDTSLNIPDVVSIEAWIRGDHWEWYSGIVAKGDGNESQSYLLQTRPGGFLEITYSHASNPNDYLWSNAYVADGHWHHIVAIIDTVNGRSAIYTDGALDAEKTVAAEPMVATAAPVTLGVSSHIFPNEYFKGVIDEVNLHSGALSEEAIVSSYQAGLEQLAGLEGMISYWRFDEGTGTTAYDFVGNNHGTIHGATWTRGVYGTALEFGAIPGPAGYVDVGNDSSLNPLHAISIEAWIRSPWNMGGIVTRGSYGRSYGLTTRGHGFLAVSYPEAGGNPNDWIWSDAYVADDRWHHIVGVIDTVNGRSRIFVDGRLDVQKDIPVGVPMEASAVPTIIGATTRFENGPIQAYTWHFTGVIDEVAIYNRTLSEGEIHRRYQEGLESIVRLHEPEVNVPFPLRSFYPGQLDVIEQIALGIDTKLDWMYGDLTWTLGEMWEKTEAMLSAIMDESLVFIQNKLETMHEDLGSMHGDLLQLRDGVFESLDSVQSQIFDMQVSVQTNTYLLLKLDVEVFELEPKEEYLVDVKVTGRGVWSGIGFSVTKDYVQVYLDGTAIDPSLFLWEDLGNGFYRLTLLEKVAKDAATLHVEVTIPLPPEPPPPFPEISGRGGTTIEK